jgi:predicted tellurium resistance membrane protein TerC
VFEVFLTAEAWVSLATLTALEIVLGIDNIVFISILCAKLPREQQASARRIGLAVAMVTRILLLLAISWVMRLTFTLFTVAGHEISGRDLILLAGGLFLIGKATVEIHEKLEIHRPEKAAAAGKVRYGWVVFQIMLLDMVFSLDSVITAVGMARHLIVMVLAVVLAVLAMLAFVGPVSDFVERHPSMKILALSFLILVGVLLVAEGLDQHIDRGYVYFAMAFSLAVELIDMRVRAAQSAPVELHRRFEGKQTA